MKIKDVLNFLSCTFPPNTACDFDNVGLLVGNSEDDVKNALISLDCTLQTVETAIAKKCELIITHHPVIFSPLKSVTENSLVYSLIKNDISVICMHTNLDIAENGVTDCLCKVLGLNNITPFISQDGFLLRKGSIPPVSADKLAEHIKKTLGGTVKYVDGGKPIEKILVCSGSGGEFISEVKTAGADALITSEVKHHQFIMAGDTAVSVFDGGHFNTEDIVIEPLKETLNNKFPEICFISDHKSKIKSI